MLTVLLALFAGCKCSPSLGKDEHLGCREGKVDGLADFLLT